MLTEQKKPAEAVSSFYSKWDMRKHVRSHEDEVHQSSGLTIHKYTLDSAQSVFGTFPDKYGTIKRCSHHT